MMRTRVATMAGISPASAPTPMETSMPTITAVIGTCGVLAPSNKISETSGV